MKKCTLVQSLGIILLSLQITHASDTEVEHGFPYWTSAETNQWGSYTDANGNIWAAYNAGSLNENSFWNPASWHILSTNGMVPVKPKPVEGWMGDSVNDGAPSYQKSSRLLRSRAAGGRIATLTFQSASTGFYRLVGDVNIDTWSPSGDITVYVYRVDLTNGMHKIYQSDVADNTLLSWETVPEVESIFIPKNHRLIFASIASGTCVMKFSINQNPSEIRQLSQPSLLLLR